MIRIVLLLLMPFVMFACKNQTPRGILKPEIMQEVLWDVMKVNVYIQAFMQKDSSKNKEEEKIKLQKQVFLLHRIEKETFDKSYSYYTTHPDLLSTILDSMINKANKEKL